MVAERDQQEAVGKKDFSAARKLLQDNLEFRGPIDTFHKADDYLHAIQKLSAIVEGVDILRAFEDGNEVSVFCDLKTKTVGAAFIAEWYKVKDGKIASVRVVFDARPFCGYVCKARGMIEARAVCLRRPGFAPDICIRLASKATSVLAKAIEQHEQEHADNGVYACSDQHACVEPHFRLRQQ
jgi:hypothetical protein